MESNLEKAVQLCGDNNNNNQNKSSHMDGKTGDDQDKTSSRIPFVFSTMHKKDTTIILSGERAKSKTEITKCILSRLSGNNMQKTMVTQFPSDDFRAKYIEEGQVLFRRYYPQKKRSTISQHVKPRKKHSQESKAAW
jgi:hypothetical protein